MNFARKLNETRKMKNKTAQQMADLLDIRVRGYRRYESGDTCPSLESLVKIADYLDCSVDYLLGRTDNPKVNK